MSLTVPMKEENLSFCVFAPFAVKIPD